MKASIIAAVYRDIEALRLIVKALRHQSCKAFELVVAEDNDAPEMRDFLASITDLEVRHTTQADQGIRKARSLNNAILAATGDYLIFIDGDCIPYSRFVEGHMCLAEPGRILLGRRVNLGPRVSAALRRGELDALTLERRYLRHLPRLARDGGSHLEQGVPLAPAGRLQRWLNHRRSTNLQMLGCNYSCFREDMLAINGYDESYGETAVADDTDLQWRFEALGRRMKSCRHAANVLHLHHARTHREIDSRREIALMHERKARGEYFCEAGLKQPPPSNQHH